MRTPLILSLFFALSACGGVFKHAAQIGRAQVDKTAEAVAIAQSGSYKIYNFAALPGTAPEEVSRIAPLFDFDRDGCFPASAISHDNTPNPGIPAIGDVTDGCRLDAFLDYSNTYYRHSCKMAGETEYCAYMFALYFLKDQWAAFAAAENHTHDIEHVIIWTKDGQMTHASKSEHGNYLLSDRSALQMDGEQAKFVYHKHGARTHSMRGAAAFDVEDPENAYGRFVTPSLVGWETMSADMQAVINNAEAFSPATFDIRDEVFLAKINQARPQSYPQF